MPITLQERKLEKDYASDIQSEFNRQGNATIRWMTSAGIFGKIDRYFRSEYPDRYEKVKASPKDIKKVEALTYNWDAKVAASDLTKPLLTAWAIKAGNIGGQTALNEMGFKGVTFNLRNPDMLEVLADSGTKITGNVTSASLTKLQKTIVQEYAKGGANPYTLKKEIAKIFKETYKGRSMTIARTELARARNTVRHDTMVKNGVKNKRWSTSLDGKERKTHGETHGQERKAEEEFSVGGWPMMHPSDSGGGAPSSEIVNCRCVAQYFIDPNMPYTPIYDGGEVAEGLGAAEAKAFTAKYSKLSNLLGLNKLDKKTASTLQSLLKAGNTARAYQLLGQLVGRQAGTFGTMSAAEYRRATEQYKKCKGL